MYDCSDQTVVTELYQKLGRAAVSKTELIVGRYDIAQEIVQEVFIKLWNAQISFPSPKAAYAWIYRSCHNASIDYLRSGNNQYETRLSFHFEPQSSEISGMRITDRLFLKRCLGLLKERDAEVFCYLIIDGMTHEEVAEFLGISRKTVGRIVKKCQEVFAKIKGESP